MIRQPGLHCLLSVPAPDAGEQYLNVGPGHPFPQKPSLLLHCKANQCPHLTHLLVYFLWHWTLDLGLWTVDFHLTPARRSFQIWNSSTVAFTSRRQYSASSRYRASASNVPTSRPVIPCAFGDSIHNAL